MKPALRLALAVLAAVAPALVPATAGAQPSQGQNARGAASAVLTEKGMSAPAPVQASAPAAAETTYAPLSATAESVYQAMALLKPVGLETGYNAAGTVSSSKLGLISTRRDDVEYPGFLLGLQGAAMARTGSPLNVAPLAVKSLEDQALLLRDRGVQTLLIDSPDPAKAQLFMGMARTLKLETVLISDTIPSLPGLRFVVDAEYYLGERIGEEAARSAGNNDVTVWYVAAPAVTEQEKQLEAGFLQPFKVSAPKVKLERVAPGSLAPTLAPPAVIAFLKPADALAGLPGLRAQFPSTRLIAPGESEALVKLFRAKAFDVRVRPDYERLLMQALAEAKQKSEFPPLMRPTVDFSN